MFPGLTQLSILNCILIGSAVYAQIMPESSYNNLQRALKRD